MKRLGIRGALMTFAGNVRVTPSFFLSLVFPSHENAGFFMFPDKLASSSLRAESETSLHYGMSCQGASYPKVSVYNTAYTPAAAERERGVGARKKNPPPP